MTRSARPLALLGWAAIALACSDSGTGALPTSTLVDACVRTTACGIRPYPRVSDCLNAYFTSVLPSAEGPGFNAIYQCVNSAGSCTTMLACFGASASAGACDQSFAGHCDGDKAISCDLIDDRAYTVDCATAGLACQKNPRNGFRAECTTGTCDAGFKRQCDGNRLLSCSDGVVAVTDCGAQGLVCAESLVPDCIGEQSESCNRGAASCDGNVAVSCIGGRTHREDCGARPTRRSCQSGACVDGGSECSDELDVCAGEALKSCLDGRWRTIDCKALGLKPCVPATNGAACGPA